MPSSRYLRLLAAAAAAGCASAANLRRGLALQPDASSSNSSLLQGSGSGSGSGSADAEMVATQILTDKLGLTQAIKNVHNRMTVTEAIHRLDGKLPKDVAALLKLKTGAETHFDEASLEKARKILNGMIQDSYAELDEVIIDCKSFEDMNRMSYGQVTTDLARIGSELAQAGEKITENYDCVGQMDKEYKSVDETLANERNSYETVLADNQAEMTIRQNDLAVFEFIMDITKCKDGQVEFLELKSTGNSSSPLHICSTSSGFELNFADPKLQAKVSKMMTKGARKAIDEALGLAFAGQSLQLVELGQTSSSSSTTTTTPLAPPAQPPTPVQESPPADAMWKKCTDGKPNCGLLHDTMSLQWGKFKDLVDELQAEMDKNKDSWDRLKTDLNDQMDVISGQKTECQTKFAEATGGKNTLTTESDEKEGQKRELTVNYDNYMATCRSRVEELLYTDVCAVRKVRNEVMKSSTVSPPEKITDCEVADWVAEMCSVPCDDTCPHRVGGQIDPFACGGKKVLNRVVVVAANEFGIVCPALTKETRCGQYRCPVDCVMSEYSAWSKCTKECGSGTRSKTRSVITKPNHGGKFCDSPVDTEPCNTGSCDRDCTLDDWTTWTPCSMACNPGSMPGFQERIRKVLVPIRAFGTCPDKDSADRFEKQTCNDHPCKGDEICVAKQDLIIAIDASGSLKEPGFEVLRDFAENLTGSYESKYYGSNAVQMGVIEFGNGARNDDGTIAPAVNVAPLTSDLTTVRNNIKGLEWQKGFTNMAQAFVLADTMLQQGGRSDAQSAVLVLSDGKYSFAFETQEAVKKLKEKGTMIYFAPIAAREGDWQKKLKEWASQPWETNYEVIPGMDVLKNNMQVFSATLVAKFCPKAISPSNEAAVDEMRGFALIHEGGFPSDDCGEFKDLGTVDTMEDCAKLAEESMQYLAFAITDAQEFYGGKRHCYAENIQVTMDLWTKWLRAREDVPCPGGVWEPNPLYDVYAIRPAMG